MNEEITPRQEVKTELALQMVYRPTDWPREKSKKESAVPVIFI